MKKTYQKPETMTVTVKSETLLTLSDPEKGFSLTGAPETDATSGNLGKIRGSRTTDDDFDDLW